MALKELDKTYKKVVDGLQRSVKGEADAIREGSFGKDVLEQFGAAGLTHEQIRQAFLRQGLEAEYQKLFDTQELKDADIYRLVMQNDVVAGVEKAFRLRARGRVQLFVGGASRAAGTSSDKGFTKYALENLPLLNEATNA